MKEMTMASKVIVINKKDNVATALRNIAAGTRVSWEVGGRTEGITLREDIPMGHKVALQDIEKGALVIKYGEPIGESTTRIAQGAHIHIHNVISQPRETGA
jgi:altronate dehydratase small subunit